ncbi:hypothetical protein JCM19233_330 [Vibrio astriarenae]|nr:hypothetical protein JCM19233_330 [Vibrio sp. C7]
MKGVAPEFDDHLICLITSPYVDMIIKQLPTDFIGVLNLFRQVKTTLL